MASLTLVSDVPAIGALFSRLCWRMSPYASYPWPYDPRSFGAQEWGWLVPAGLGSLAACSLLCALVHSLAFAIAALVHRAWGWPPYWRVVGPRLRLHEARAASAKRIWWTGPLLVAIELTLEKLSDGFGLAGYYVNRDSLPSWGPLGAVILAAFFSSSMALSDAVAGLVTADEFCCRRCGYLLRGLERPRCPECGHDYSEAKRVEYGMVPAWAPGWMCGRGMRAVLFVVLMLAPAWVPLAVMQLPASTANWLPAGLEPNLVGARAGMNPLVPVRFDHICVLRQGKTLIVVRFVREGPYRQRCVARYWAHAKDLPRPPDITRTGKVNNGSGPQLDFGGWFLDCAWGDQNMIWLGLPGSGYEAEVLRPEEYESKYPSVKASERE